MGVDSLIRERVKTWTEDPYFDEATRQEILSITDEQELAERFCCNLEFGTAGIRGILGAGTNRLNIYIIRKVIQGLADTIKDYGEEACQRGVVIAYDCRRYSIEFAREAALVLAANGIKAYLFDKLRPTPELSFAIRYLKTMAGIMITASHNPKNYNGCKVYWEDGAQLPPKQSDEILVKMEQKAGWRVETMGEELAREKGLLVMVGAEVDEEYLKAVKKELLNTSLTKEKGADLKLVFTPLHGTGYDLVPKLLREIGFSALTLVPEQQEPDGEFPTAPIPNPEDESAFEIALKYGLEQQAQLIIATDPDADRMGVLVRDHLGDYRKLTGNQIGIIMIYYLLSQRKAKGILPRDGVVIKNIVSSELADEIAFGFDVKLINVLVGFKYIGEQIKGMEESGRGTFLFGFEESHGYLAGTYARDKDAILGSALFAEAALYYLREKQQDLFAVLEEIYQRFGYYLDGQIAMSFDGLEGKKKMEEMMAKLRQGSYTELGGLALKEIEDYLAGQGKNVLDGSIYPLGLPQANLLRFAFQGGGYIMARPSGTEPKIRFYFCIKGEQGENLTDKLKTVQENFLSILGLNR